MSVVITKSLKKSAFLNNSSNTRINKAEPAKDVYKRQEILKALNLRILNQNC